MRGRGRTGAAVTSRLGGAGSQVPEALGRLVGHAREGVVPLPALVRGHLVWPSLPPADLLAQAATNGPGPWQVGNTYVCRVGADPGAPLLVLPYVVPVALLEQDPAHLARCLYAMPVRDLLEALGRVRDCLAPGGAVVSAVNRVAAEAGVPLSPVQGLLWRMLHAVFDPPAIEAAVDSELARAGTSGRAYLDGWVPIDGEPRPGATARLAEAVFSRPMAGPDVRGSAGTRAVPTRQLHVTPTNTPLGSIASLVRGLAVKGACAVKAPAEHWRLTTAVALSLAALGSDHPLAHHTSIAYWRGGDRAVEDVLLSSGAFDRIVVWGGQRAVGDVRSRTTTRTVLFEPRVGMSLIGRASFDEDVDRVAELATVDTLVENQAACTSSLVHFVEGSEGEALRYCAALQRALARWDDVLPSRTAGPALLRLRRGVLVRGRWFVNGAWPAPTSAVVLAPHPVDVSEHPGGRCVIVRRVDDLSESISCVDRRVSAIGIHPPDRWSALRDELAGRGVTTVTLLGQTERRWPGMPHDGMQVLSELVNWSVC
jgi:hypothetical protein